jgi:acetyltransferase
MDRITEKINFLFHPKSVAVIGASDSFGKWGFNIINRILLKTGDMRIYPINPKATEILGIKAYATILDVPDEIDLAVIVIPPSLVLEAMKDCVKKVVKVALVITAGFREVGQEGIGLESEMLRIAHKGGIRVVGPNCMGHFSVNDNLFTTGSSKIRPGPISLISQSGNFGGYIVDRGTEKGVGFNKFVSSGNEADLTIEDFVEYFGEDEQTRIICAYIEGLKDGRRFFELARKISRKKPIIVMKGGRTREGAQAAMSHTGSLSGADDIHDAAFRQAGVIRVNKVDELLDIASAFIRQSFPRGRRIGIITGGGGFGVVAADACRRMGLELPLLSQETITRLNRWMPPRWPHANPVDMAGDPYGSIPCIGTLLKAPEIDGILAVSCLGFMPRPADDMPEYLRKEFSQHQQDMAKGELAAMDGLIERVEKHNKPLIIAAVSYSMAMAKLARHDIYTYRSPEDGARVMAFLADYAEYLSKS